MSQAEWETLEIYKHLRNKTANKKHEGTGFEWGGMSSIK